MPVLKFAKPKGKTLASRLSGVSCPIAGVTWNPSHEDRARVQELLEYLESRRGFHRPFNAETVQFLISLIREIDGRLKDEIEKSHRPTPLKESLIGMQAACERFLERTMRTQGMAYKLEVYYATCLGELRSILGLHIARLACAYDIEVPSELLAIIPRESEYAEKTPEPVSQAKGASKPASKPKSRTRRSPAKGKA